MKAAARLYFRQDNLCVGDFRDPRLKPLGKSVTVCHCFRRENCPRYFRFTGHWVEGRVPSKYHLGESAEKPRQARQARHPARQQSQPSTEQAWQALKNPILAHMSSGTVGSCPRSMSSPEGVACTFPVPTSNTTLILDEMSKATGHPFWSVRGPETSK